MSARGDHPVRGRVSEWKSGHVISRCDERIVFGTEESLIYSRRHQWIQQVPNTVLTRWSLNRRRLAMNMTTHDDRRVIKLCVCFMNGKFQVILVPDNKTTIRASDEGLFQERLQNHRVEFRVTRLSTRWNDSGLGLWLGIGLGSGSGQGYVCISSSWYIC